MNRQPYGTPPRWWEPKLSPLCVKLTHHYRWQQLHRGQRLVNIDVEGLRHVRDAVDAGQGVLITPNHSTHYDSNALYVALDKISQPVYIMTAWQVFSMSRRLETWFMQRLGCFSIDRESNDRQAYKQAVHILQREPYPLVIFPEGDIYHVSDQVTRFREGAAGIALAAARRSERPVVIIPCGIKFWYVEDPTAALLDLLERLENRVVWRPHPDLSLFERIHRLAEGVVALKELDFLGKTQSGRVRDRTRHLVHCILARLEQDHRLRDNAGIIPERVKALRQCIIRKAERGRVENIDQGDYFLRLERDMDDLFFVMQLYSYPGDYLDGQPSIERLAETLDKLEEDILRVALPTVRGRRQVTIRFGEPIAVPNDGQRRSQVAPLTQKMQGAVQGILDSLNAQFGQLLQRETKSQLLPVWLRKSAPCRTHF